jgi:hypothetical protein
MTSFPNGSLTILVLSLLSPRFYDKVVDHHSSHLIAFIDPRDLGNLTSPLIEARDKYTNINVVFNHKHSKPISKDAHIIGRLGLSP